ncbi:MAG: SDR family NAD(P)-dependent oxidoreductase [Actinobacteria bacterium]|nr:SDR family NAD(P)-dependent oxidoreductase [Actinomycetota bacterium]
MSKDRGLAVVTGASSGIGWATVERLVAEGFRVIAGARRVERLDELAERTGCTARALDVTDPDSVATFTEDIGALNVLVNNAGLASGLSPLPEIEDERLQVMWNTNVMGVLRVTRALLPQLEESERGHIVNIGSIAGRDVYVGGGGYTATKHALRAVSQTMRLELLGKPIRITEIAPGLVETEFSVVRFDGDVERAKELYEGVRPLVADDIADCVTWAVTRPPHVNVDELVVRPLAQSPSGVVHRRPIPGL